MTPSEVSRLPEYALLNLYQDSADVALRIAARDELDRRRRLNGAHGKGANASPRRTPAHDWRMAQAGDQ